MKHSHIPSADRPLVSVIVPTYNRPVGLAELLESLSRQTFRAFEVIVVNDAGPSVDRIVGLYPELDVTVINNEANLGHVRSRNAALGLARGEWIMPCDDDDLLVPIHMERMLREAADADLLYSDAEIVEYDTDDGGLVRLPRRRRLFAYTYDPEGMRQFSTYIPSGSLYRKAVHEVIGPFDPDMYHYWDWDFMLRAMNRFRVKRVAMAGVLYAFSPSSGNLSGNLDAMRPYLDRLCAKHGLGRLPVKNFYLLLEEPGVKAREADSERVWDGLPLRSRLARGCQAE